MTNDQIISTLQKWQRDMMTKTRGVFVKYYDLQPQDTGFMLDLELHIDGKTDNEIRTTLYVYGKTLSELFDKAEARIEEEKIELRKALDE